MIQSIIRFCFSILLVLAVRPEGSPLRGPGGVTTSFDAPLMKGMIPLMFLFLLSAFSSNLFLLVNLLFWNLSLMFWLAVAAKFFFEGLMLVTKNGRVVLM